MTAVISGLDTKTSFRQVIYQELCNSVETMVNRDILASIMASWIVGEGALPSFMGLEPLEFLKLSRRYFPGSEDKLPRLQQTVTADAQRQPEREDLLNLLMRNRAGHDESEVWLAEIVVAACMGGNHLWQDLGLWSRDQLSQLLLENFPGLATLNVKNMKWKKFFYKQLCQEEGIYVCRSPSCEVCVDYMKCFGPED